MAKYKLSKLAEQDFRGIAQYSIRKFGAKQAREYETLLIQTAKLLSNFPSMGLPYTTKKGRVFQKYRIGSHALFYQPDETGIFIVRVLHLMMDFDKHLDN